MFTKSHADSKLDEEIASALSKLESLRENTEEYNTVLERVSRLQKLKSPSRLEPPSLNTVLAVGANVFTILWLTRYEKEHVIPSRAALGFVLKPK